MNHFYQVLFQHFMQLLVTGPIEMRWAVILHGSKHCGCKRTGSKFTYCCKCGSQFSNQNLWMSVESQVENPHVSAAKL